MSISVKCELGFANFLSWEWSLFNATKKGKMFLRFGNGISRYFIKGNEVGIREHCLDIGTSHVPPFLDRQYRLPANKRTVILISINRYNNRSKSIQGKKDNYITKNDVSCNEKRFWLRQAGFAGNSKGLSRDA